MKHGKQNKMSDYQLRAVAGTFFLLDMKQSGIPYEKPLQLNQIAAEMWKLFLAGNTEEQIVELLVQKYGVQDAEVREDLYMFCDQMNKLGISMKD